MPGEKVNLYEWDSLARAWVPVQAYVTDKRLTEAGLVYEGAVRLDWISMNPSAANAVFVLTDAYVSGADPKYDHYHASRDSHHMNIQPALRFANGIYLETLTSFTSLIFGYTPE